MTCQHCNAAEQRGRYCVGCGKLLPPSPLPARRVRLAPRHLENDDTQPVLRFRVTPRILAEALTQEEAPAAV
jgi:methionyl-tRNA synthetase